MTRDEMIKFVKNNPFVHVSHMNFSEDEYIFGDDKGNVITEEGYLFEDWYSEDRYGIRMRIGGNWENGWYIKEEN